MIERRDVLGGIAGIASMAAVAGCTGFVPGGAGGNQLPAYHRYVAAEGAAEDGVFFATIDLARFRELEDGALEEAFPADAAPSGGEAGADPDPLLAYPTLGLLVAAFGVSFGLFAYGFSGEVASGFSDTPLEDGTGTPGASDGGTETPDDATRVDSLVVQSTAMVLEGRFDPATLAGDARGFTPDGEYDGYEVYVGGGSESVVDTGSLAFAVDGETLIALVDDERDDPRAALEGAIDVAAGADDRLADDPDADWALRTAGHGFTTLGGWGIDPDEVEPADEVSGSDLGVESVLDRAPGLVSSLSFDAAAGATTATAAAVYPEGETPTEEQLEADLGGSATERDVTIDGTRVTVTATWSVAGTTDA